MAQWLDILHPVEGDPGSKPCERLRVIRDQNPVRPRSGAPTLPEMWGSKTRQFGPEKRERGHKKIKIVMEVWLLVILLFWFFRIAKIIDSRSNVSDSLLADKAVWEYTLHEFTIEVERARQRSQGPLYE